MMPRDVPGGKISETRPILLAEEPRSRVVRAVPWAAAFLVTLALHSGLFWYLTRETPADDLPIVTEPAAVMIDMSPEVQQAFSQTDAAVGQPMEAPTEPPPPPPDEPKPEPMPPVEESPTEAVAPLPPKPPEKPKVEKKLRPKPKKVEKKQSVKKDASAASAPRSDQHAQRTTASSSGAASSAQVADWKSQVAAALNRNKRYPSGADAYGAPTIRMTISSSGVVGGVGVVASSGSSELDNAAVETAQRSSPLPPPPSGGTSLTFRMNFHRR